jgi:hypothetical protein
MVLGATSCMNDTIPEVPELPTVDTSKEYAAMNVYSGNIYMATNRGVATDSAVVRAFVARLKANEAEYPFRKIQADGAPAVQQRLSFSGDSVLLQRGAKEADAYIYTVAHMLEHSLLWMADKDTTYMAKRRPEAIINRLGFYNPANYEATDLDPAQEEFDVTVTKNPEYYAAIGKDELQFPGITYYLKTKEGWVGSGDINNFLNQTFYSALSEGDTILIQGFRTDFK